jgi:hypothetical protein
MKSIIIIIPDWLLLVVRLGLAVDSGVDGVVFVFYLVDRTWLADVEVAALRYEVLS